ncbi:MAG TPA: hypothetical protein DEF35_29100 [Paenibacillus sp.]|uniref:hypothetical protein n=1 Tax=Paenibacillus TaxID=44249 RepID=UPI000BA00A00|nr:MULTISPECIES: hypothetical protein [Paenibacillus]OZQ65469.1 hypothetical protein CA599_20305 [Paenibacillus taichungensis]HBU85671.1 hypothetical protein [Paenibacillus sp.]
MIKVKSRKIAFIISSLLFLLTTVLSCYLIFFNENSKSAKRNISISIGVPEVENPIYQYQKLKSDLEAKFDIKVNFVELYPESQNIPITENDVIDNTYKKVKNGEIDIISGLTPNKLAPLVQDKLLLDITDQIVNKNNLHLGVLNSSLKGGNGKIYYISPVIKTVYFVLQNEKVFKDLGVELLPIYPTYDEFLNTLNLLETSSKKKGAKYSPIALAVKNTGDDELFIGTQLRMFGYNLETPFYNNGQIMNEEWRELYDFFATMVKKYGKGYEEYEDGIYPIDNIFSNGNYGTMISNAFNMELYTNDEFNKEWNSQSPVKIEANFPINISFLPTRDGSEIQNIRQSTLAVVKERNNKDILLEIVNYILSEEYTLKMLESRGDYNNFSNYPLSYPTFYNEKTVSILNRAYNGNFDASMIYKVQDGSAVETYPIPDGYNNFDMSVNEALTDVYNNEKTIEESYQYIFELFEE